MSWLNPQTQQVRWLDALNTSGEEIPGHAVIWMNSAGFASEYGLALPENPYVIEVFRFPAEFATFNYSINVGGYYGPVCEIQEQYHDVMENFAVNGPVPIPPGATGVVTCDPPFVALSNTSSTLFKLVPVAGQWHLSRQRDSDDICGGAFKSLEWFRVLRDMLPGSPGVRPMLVDIDSVHSGDPL